MLDTIQDYLTQARIVLQDVIAPYRYDDASLQASIDMGILESMRIRPDMFLGVTTLTSYAAADPATKVSFDPRYRSALLYYILGHAEMRDDEATQDQRSAIFKQRFVQQLMGQG